MALLLALEPACKHPPPPPPVTPQAETTPSAEEVVREFMGLVRRDALTYASLERLVSIEALTEGIALTGGEGLSPEARRRQLGEALLLLMKGDGPLRQALVEGSLMYWERRRDERAVVEVTQVLPNRETYVHDVELERIDGRWRIRRFLPPREPGTD